MVLARVAEYFYPSHSSNPTLNYIDNGGDQQVDIAQRSSATRWPEESVRPASPRVSSSRAVDVDHESYRPPYIHSMLAGGLGGTMGDMLMHSLDTVKTRQQGDPHMPPKYTSMGNTYYTIFRQEGVWRGLYGGVTPAFLGSFSEIGRAHV